MIKITVVITIYNIEKYISRCLESILNQSYENLEIICVDDGSIDNSPNIVAKCIKDRKNAMLVTKKNGGPISARQLGVTLATGDYVSFVDGDDWVEKDCYAILVKQINENNFPDLIMFNVTEDLPFGSRVRVNQSPNCLYELDKLEQLKEKVFMGDHFFCWGVLPYSCSKLYSTDLLKNCIFDISPNIKYGDGIVLTTACMALAKRVLLIPISHYHYVRRQNSIVNGNTEISTKYFHLLFKELEKHKTSEPHLFMNYDNYRIYNRLLWNYNCFSNEMLLFPFPIVSKGDRVFVYGAGRFGKIVVNHILENDNLILSGWTDSQYESFKTLGYDIASVNDMYLSNYDYIYIAILDENVAAKLCKTFVEKGVNANKILYITLKEIEEWIKFDM